MKRLIFSILFIAAGVMACDWLVEKAMWWVNQHSNDISAPKIKYLAYEADEDFIAMGTSRCNTHYVAAILEDSIGMTCYNGGIDASDNIYSHYLLLQLLLRHHTPKVICLEVMGNDCYIQNDPFERTSYFAPYFGQNEVSDSIFRLAGTYNLYKYCRTYRYNARAVSNIVGTFFSPYVAFEKGYLPGAQPPHFPELLGVTRVEELAIDTMKLDYVQRFVSQCHNHGIKVIFCISPNLSITEEGYYEPLKELARKNLVPVLDYHSQGLYHDHPEYFRDNSHLWDKGARLFSQCLGHDLKMLLTE